MGHVFENIIESIARRHAEIDPHQQEQLQTALLVLNPTENFEADEPNEVGTHGRPPSGSQSLSATIIIT